MIHLPILFVEHLDTAYLLALFALVKDKEEDYEEDDDEYDGANNDDNDQNNVTAALLTCHFILSLRNLLKLQLFLLLDLFFHLLVTTADIM